MNILLKNNTTELLKASTQSEFGDSAAGVISKEGIIVFDPSLCVVGMVEKLLDYAMKENCGKCVPCREGSGTMHKMISKILGPDSEEKDIEHLRVLAETANRCSDCSFGEILGKMVLDTLDNYAEEYKAHVNSEAKCELGKCSVFHYTPCQIHCPLKTDIAYFIHAISLGAFTESRTYLDCVNYFPKTLGLVCGICKELCTLKKEKSGSIDINGLKSFVCDMPYRKSYSDVHCERASYSLSHPTHAISLEAQKKQKKIAVVGMGPAGLVSALFLLKKGYSVEGFDMYDEIGGLTMTGIPPERLPKDILLKELGRAGEAGGDRFKLHLNTKIGTDVSIEKLQKDFDAVLLSPGSQNVMNLNLPGSEEAEGIYNFLYFLERVNRGELEKPGDTIGVIGGGNAAMDVSTAARKFGSNVTVYYRKVQERMPADPAEYDIALSEGVNFEFEMTPKEYVHKNGKLVGMKFETVDKDIVFRKMDAVVPSIGQYPDISILPKSHDLKLSSKEVVETNESGETTSKNLFTAGDFRVGKTVVHSMAEGIDAAEGIDKRLSPSGEFDSEGQAVKKKLINIARNLCGDDPYVEELREMWNFSIKPAIRGKKRKSRIEASMREASACLRCRQIIVVAQKKL